MFLDKSNCVESHKLKNVPVFFIKLINLNY